MVTTPKQIFAAARKHGVESDEPDHEVGDLQGVILAAWSLMDREQRSKLVDHYLVTEVLSWRQE